MRVIRFYAVTHIYLIIISAIKVSSLIVIVIIVTLTLNNAYGAILGVSRRVRLAISIEGIDVIVWLFIQELDG